MNRLISKQEAANILGCSQQTVNNWIDDGFITGHKVGTRLMVDRDSIVRYFDKIKDLFNMEQKLGEMKTELEDAIREQQTLLDELKGDHIRSRRIRDSFRKTQFMIMDIAEEYFEPREKDVLRRIINDDDPKDIASTYGLKTGTIYLIAEKAANKLVEIEELCKENVSLKKENDRLTKKCHEMEERLQEYEYENKLNLTIFEKPLDDYKITISSLKRLKRFGCLTVGDLVKKNRKEVAGNYYLGRKPFTEADTLLSKLGLHWGMNLKAMPRSEIKKWSIV
jgi:excisionase family DNA binding protein